MSVASVRSASTFSTPRHAILFRDSDDDQLGSPLRDGVVRVFSNGAPLTLPAKRDPPPIASTWGLPKDARTITRKTASLRCTKSQTQQMHLRATCLRTRAGGRIFLFLRTTSIRKPASTRTKQHAGSCHVSSESSVVFPMTKTGVCTRSCDTRL